MANRFFQISCLVLLIAYSNQARSQSWEDLNDSLTHYYQESLWDKAIPVAGKMVEVSGKENNGQTTRHATALNNLAYLLNQSGDKSGAAIQYKAAYLLRMFLLEPDDEDCLSVVQSLATVYTDLRNFSAAITLYSDYLTELEKNGKQQSTAGVMAWYRRAVIYLNLGKNNEAGSDLLSIAGTYHKMLADTIVYYNTYDFLVSIMANEYDLAKAEPVFLQYTALCKMVDGPGSAQYGYSLYNLAGLYTRSGNSRKAEPLMREVVELYSKLYGKESEQYIAAVMHLTTVLSKSDKREEAVQRMRTITGEIRKKLGESSRQYESVVFKAAMAMLQGTQWDEGRQYLESAISSCRMINDSALLFVRIQSLDSILSEKDLYSEKVPLMVELISIQEKHPVITDSSFSKLISGLASVYIDLRDYAMAYALAEKYDSIARRCFSGDTEQYLQSRRDAAYLFSLMERADIAEKYYEEALRVARKIWGESSDKFAILLRNIGSMYSDAGQQQKAATVLKKAALILENNKSSQYDQLAFIYQKLSRAYDLNAAKTEEESYLIRAVNTAKKIPDDYVITGILYNDLAYYYESQKQYEKADSIYEESRIRNNRPGHKVYSVFLTAMAQQAVNAMYWGKKEKAARLIKEMEGLAKSYYKDSANWEERLMIFQSEYYRISGQYTKAVKIGQKMLQQQTKLVGEESPGLAALLVILTRLFFEAQDFKEAEKVVSRLNKITLASMLKNFAVLTDSEKENYIANKFNAQHLSNTLLLRNQSISADFAKETFSQTVLLKSLILSENRKITESVLQSADTSLQNRYRDWLSLRQLLAREYAKPEQQRQKGVPDLEGKAEQLQKEITGKSSGLLKQQTRQGTDIRDFQQRMAANEAVIEFVYFGVFREKADSGLYAAFILRKDSKSPVFVPLCERKELKKLFDSAGTTATSMVSRFYRGAEVKSKSAATVLGTALYKLVWEPLEPHLKGVKKINYSPANKLFSIAFHALPVDSNTVLMDRYELNQYSSTRILASDKKESSGRIPSSIVLFGNPSFSLDSADLVKTKKTDPAGLAVSIPSERGNNSSSWSELPGTAEEVRKVKELFEHNKIDTRAYTRVAATEENLKALSGHSPMVLHIATHGFFLPVPEKKESFSVTGNQNAYSIANDPLLRSGIVLAGGNRVWSGKDPIDQVEDGIATAYEISQLDLSGTELVVLSACETALGDIKGNEGVFGLQRAFKMAGVKKMIVSLWQVPDKETAELMTAFYSYWLKGKTINEAFAQAQEEMRRKYSPYYWAAFVLVE